MLVNFSVISLLLFNSVSHATNVTTTQTSLLLSKATPGATGITYTDSFTPSDTTDTIATILVQFATTATGNTVPTGFTMSATPSVTLKTGATPITNTAAYSAGLLTITITTPQALTSSVATISIVNVTNPSVSGAIFYSQITTESSGPVVRDYGVAESEVYTDVGVSGIIDPVLVFSVTGIASGTGTTGAMNPPTVTSTSNNISYGHFLINPSGPNVAVQQITTNTNAINGYTVYLQENQPLTDGAATIPNVGANTTWTNASTVGFGVNVTNGANGDKGGSFGNNTTYQPIPTSVGAGGLALASLNTPTNTAGDNEYVIYQVGISGSITSGTYSNSLDYVVVPVF